MENIVKTTLDKVHSTFHYKGIPYEIVKKGTKDGEYTTARYVDHHELDEVHNKCVVVYKTDTFGREQEVELWSRDW